MTELHLDYETYSELDLKVAGLDRYSRQAEVMMCAYSFDDGPDKHWQRDDGPFPAELKDALTDPEVKKWGFNAQFERTITRNALKLATPIKGWRCTMALAYLQSFAGTLGEVGSQIGLPTDKLKDKDGRRLIGLFCKPQKITNKQPFRRRDAVTDPWDWSKFCEYNIGDNRSERAVKRRLLPYPIPDNEWLLYELDQEINDRGMPVDVSFCRNAVFMAQRRTQEHIEDLRQITGLMNPNSPMQFLPWLRERGYRFNDLQKATVQKVITEDEETPGGTLTDEARDALKLRQWAARISSRKFTSVTRALAADGRIRFLFQFAGASRTARWAGRRVQAHNLPRTPKILEAPKPYESHELLSIVTDVIRSGDYEGLGLYVKEPLEAIVGCTRSMFRAPEGYEFIVCDLAAIESLVIAWLSGCERLLQVFRDGRDPYKDFAQTLYRCLYEAVTREQRSGAKPAVLGAGYRLGGGELKDGKRTGLWGYAESMGVNMTQAESETAVRVFRATYPEIPQLWYALENAAISCIKLQRPRTVGPIRFEWHKPYLVIVLPSGRRAYYYKPRLHKLKFVSKKTGEPYEKIGISYMGQDQKTGVWTRLFTHGGKTTENVVQMIARDILAVGMQRARATNYPIVGHVHDEIIAQRRIGDNRFTLDGLREHMTSPIEWLPGLPLNAAGYIAPFYRKD